MPVHGQVVAKDLDVAWVRQLNPRIEALGGQVSANAKLAGTLADPQFIGDVRWKDGGATLARSTNDAADSASGPAIAALGGGGRVARPRRGVKDRVEIQTEVVDRLIARQTSRR